MRLLLDEMFPSAIAVSLREAGHDVVAVQEMPSLHGWPDSWLLAEAQRQGRALVTENVRDFMRLLSTRAGDAEPHYGVILTASGELSRHRKRFIGATVSALAGVLDHPSVRPASLVVWI